MVRVDHGEHHTLHESSLRLRLSKKAFDVFPLIARRYKHSAPPERRETPERDRGRTIVSNQPAHRRIATAVSRRAGAQIQLSCCLGDAQLWMWPEWRR